MLQRHVLYAMSPARHQSNPAVPQQALNVGIYRAIGNPGVYYGFKLGHHVPWHTGFPFNVVSHPQYVGSALTVWGAVILVSIGSMFCRCRCCPQHWAYGRRPCLTMSNMTCHSSMLAKRYCSRRKLDGLIQSRDVGL